MAWFLRSSELSWLMKTYAYDIRLAHGEQDGRDIFLAEGLGVLGRVSADLSEAPGGGGLDVVFVVRGQGFAEGRDAFGDDDGHRETFIEAGDEAEGHDARELGHSGGVVEVVDEGSRAAVMDDDIRELGGLFGDFADAVGGISADLGIGVLQTVQDLGEDIGLGNCDSQLFVVLCDVRQTGTHLLLDLLVRMGDEQR